MASVSGESRRVSAGPTNVSAESRRVSGEPTNVSGEERHVSGEVTNVRKVSRRQEADNKRLNYHPKTGRGDTRK